MPKNNVLRQVLETGTGLKKYIHPRAVSVLMETSGKYSLSELPWHAQGNHPMTIKGGKTPYTLSPILSNLAQWQCQWAINKDIYIEPTVRLWASGFF